MTDFPQLDDAGLIAALRASVERARSAHADVVSVVGEMKRRGLNVRTGHASLAQLLKHTTRMDTREAKRLLVQVEAVCPTVTATGALVEPRLPLVASAAAEGVLSSAHLSALAAAMQDLPAEAEQTLVDTARAADPVRVRFIADKIRASTEEPLTTAPAKPRNMLQFKRKRDGRLQFTGTLTPEHGEKFPALVSDLTAPESSDRTLIERQGDGFADLLDLAARSPRPPNRQRTATTTDFETLKSGLGITIPSQRTVKGQGNVRTLPIRTEMLLDPTCRSLTGASNLRCRDQGRGSHTRTITSRDAHQAIDGHTCTCDGDGDGDGPSSSHASDHQDDHLGSWAVQVINDSVQLPEQRPGRFSDIPPSDPRTVRQWGVTRSCARIMSRAVIRCSRVRRVVGRPFRLGQVPPRRPSGLAGAAVGRLLP